MLPLSFCHAKNWGAEQAQGTTAVLVLGKFGEIFGDVFGFTGVMSTEEAL